MFYFLLFIGDLWLLRFCILELRENPLMVWHVFIAFATGFVMVWLIFHFFFEYLPRR